MDRSKAARAATVEQLYEAHITRALRLAYLVCGDRDVADDLAHDAFERAIGRFHHLRNPELFWPYLRRSIINGASSWWRRRVTERVALARHDAQPKPPPATSTVEDRDPLWRIVRTLPVRQRTALILRYFEDLSEQESALVMGCSRAAVRSLTTRGLNALRDRISQENSDGS
ncbi:MAG: hypothetical protein QOC87_1724 [Actinomycetota bacterium]|nr:hypothetical protein [Actinomycetota bacterium]